MTIILALLLVAIEVYLTPTAQPCPDGIRYFSMSEGEIGERPFNIRFVVPRLLGLIPVRRRQQVWSWGSLISLLLTSLLLMVLARRQGLTWEAATFSAAIFFGLPGVVRANLRLRCLTDSFGMLGMLIALLLPTVPACALLLGLIFVNEKAAILGGLVVWWPIALLAALIVVLALRSLPHAAPKHIALSSPFLTGRQYRSKDFFSGKLLLPWGVALVGLLSLDITGWLVLLVAYAMTFVATDSVRIYQWGFVGIVLATASLVPPEIMPVALLLHYWNPARGVWV